MSSKTPVDKQCANCGCSLGTLTQIYIHGETNKEFCGTACYREYYNSITNPALTGTTESNIADAAISQVIDFYVKRNEAAAKTLKKETNKL